MNNSLDKKNITSIVVTFNEARHLGECLDALDFCQEKILIDLYSTDDSVVIARKHGCRIIQHKKVEIVEEIREWATQQASNDWVIFIDPDEIFPKEFIDEICKKINDKKIGGVSFKRINYFIGEPVRHGLWYGKTRFIRFFNKKAVNFNDLVHDGMRTKKEFRFIKSDFTIKHYWIDSLEQFYEKHNRYLKHEGKSRYERGERFSISKLYLYQILNFLKWFIIQHGFLDVKNGWKLIKLAIWYDYSSWIMLKKYQEQIENKY